MSSPDADVQSFSPDRNGKPRPREITPLPLPIAAEPEADFRQFLLGVRRRSILIIGVAIGVTAAIGLWTVLQKPEYESKFQLLVESVTADDKLTELTQSIPNAPTKTTGLDYNTQIQVLRSPELMAAIVKRLQTRYPEITYSGLMSSLTVIRPQETKILEIRFQDSNPDKVKFVLDQVADGYLKYSLQERQTNLRQGIQFVEGQLTTLRQRVDKLQAQLQKFRQQHNLLDPDLQATQLTTQVSAIAQQRLDTEKQLAEAQALYTNLQGSAGATTAMKDAPLYQKLLDQLREVNTKIAQESARFSDRNPAVQALRDQQQALLPLIRQEAQRVLGDKLAEVATQAAILEVRSQTIAQTEANLNQQVNQLPALSRQYTDLKRELDVANQSLNRFLANRETLQVNAAQKEIPWQQLSIPERPQTPFSPNKSRNFLLGSIAGLLLGIAIAMLVERIDDQFHAVEDLKSRTKLPILGTVPHYLELPDRDRLSKDRLSKDRLSKDFLDRDLDHDRLDSIPSPPRFGQPLLKQLKLLMSRHSLDSGYVAAGFLEAFRSLYTNICLLGSDSPIRSIVTSSALPGDGKSTIAVALAQAAAAMGQRVLLVDADLRRPQIGRRLDLPNLKGLSTLIATEVEFDQVVQRSSTASLASWASGGLWVLTSGPVPPDATKLLSSKKMQHLMEKLKTQFDLVIYDTPPLLGFADSTLLATHTDGIVMVVRLEKTDRSAIAQALEGLKLANTSILGLVANDSKHDRAASSEYHHYYTAANRA